MRTTTFIVVVSFGVLLRCTTADYSAARKPLVAIEVVTPEGTRPLNGLLTTTHSVTIRITLLDDAAKLVRVTRTALEDPPDSEGNIPPPVTRDVTTGNFDLATGNHTFTVTAERRGRRETVVAGMLVLDPETGAAHTPVYEPFVRDRSAGVAYESATLLLAFQPGTPISQVSSTLNRLGLNPLSWTPDIALVRARIMDGSSPLRLGRSLAERSLLPVTAVIPNIVLQEDAVIGEQMPPRLTMTYRASAGMNCRSAGTLQGCFEGGDGRDRELRVFRYHFYYDTFAGHRLVNHLLQNVAQPRPVGIAVLDTGFGNGQNRSNIPRAALFNFAQAPFYSGDFRRFDDAGVQECRPNATAAWAPCDFRFADVRDIGSYDVLRDEQRDPHGTSVAIAAAGRPDSLLAGNQDRGILGTGLHARIRVMRVIHTAQVDGVNRLVFDLEQSVVAVVGAARDADVQILNTSFGNRRAEGRAAWINTEVERVMTNVINLARDRGKIWTASAGNDSQCTDPDAAAGVGPCPRTAPGHWPSDFAPGPGARAAGDSLMISTGNVGTREDNTGPEQLSRSSNYGPRISVTAGGDEVILPMHDGDPRGRSGTSFSAPAVAGLAAEMLYLDRNTANRFTPLQIIELIEATADDLGTAERAAGQRSRPNNKAADGRDEFFGHGRINVWKALLAVANGGTATDVRAAFPSLRTAAINNDTWYGFVLQGPVYDASIWIDGTRLQDPMALRPAGNAGALTRDLNLYKGIPSNQVIQRGIDVNADGVPDEDPTSDVVPVGVTRGEYLATFSIQRRDLTNCRTPPCTLSLRRPGQTAADAPFFNLRLQMDLLTANRVPGVVYDDFVFEITPTEFGDAPPSYPSRLIADNGARGLNANLEWLGPNTDTGRSASDVWIDGVSPELNAMTEGGGPDATADPDGTENIQRRADLDRFDEGVVFYPRTYTPDNRNARVDFTVCVAEPTDSRYGAGRDKRVWVNGWIDWNTNGTWEEGGNEHVVDGAGINPRDWTVEVRPNSRTEVMRLRRAGRCATYRALFRVAAAIEKTGDLWSRFRLDYGEDVGRNDPRPNDRQNDWRSDPTLRLTQGASRFGEVEDYLIGTDYGDAPDPSYPTRHATRGAYALNFTREWLGPDAADARVSRELDGCDQTTAEEDPVPNLDARCEGADRDQQDDGVGVPAMVTPGEEIVVQITVTGQIDTRGFSNRGPNNESSAGVMTLKPNCILGAIAAAPATPAIHRDRGRYAAWRGTQRLYLNAWADWNGDGDWSGANEYVLANRPIDPEDFGPNGRYTLGEPFVDNNNDGAYTPGVDEWIAARDDVAGNPTRAIQCRVKVPDDVVLDKTFYWRFRLDHGENVTPNDAVIRYAILPMGESRNLATYRGGTWWGEVEDYPSKATKPPPTKKVEPSSTYPGGTLRYTITLPTAVGVTTPTKGFIRDQLPPGATLSGEPRCSRETCTYDARTRTVSWAGELLPNGTTILEYIVTVPPYIPYCPTEIVNKAKVFDGTASYFLSATAQIECSTKRR